jgi:cytochrome c-type biogenesis protein CcmH
VKTWCRIVLCITLAISAPLLASDVPASLSTPALAARYDALLEQLRCMVCQNQTLKDSHADLAQDLRDEVRRLLEQGNTDVQIRDYLVARYGDFVLYSPPLQGSTWLLWLGPFLLLILALAVVLKLSRSRAPQAAPLNDAERARLQAALGKSADSQP